MIKNKKAVLLYLEKKMVKQIDKIAKKAKLSRTALIHAVLSYVLENK